MADECMELVRLWDRDRYLATLFAPDEKQPHLYALFAFDAEVARIPTLVSEPQIGEIRMQWWADTLEAIADGQAVNHPVAQRLADTIRAHALPVAHLMKLIDARRGELYADQFPDRFSLESHIAETDATLMQYAAMVLDPAKAASAAEGIGLAASAFGLARVLLRARSEPKFIPPGETIGTLQALARERLQQARQIKFPQSLLPVVLPAALTELYINGSPSALKRQWRLWRAARSGRL
jgi:15-cis-phytoene synthase